MTSMTATAAELPLGCCPGCGGKWPGAGYVCNGCGWRPGEVVFHGLSAGHGCNDCFQLRIRPAAIRANGPNYELVASITAGHGDRAGPDHGTVAARGQVDILAGDIPGVIAELRKIHDRAVRSEAEQRIPPEWPVL
jgi:hypothetical protein